MPDNTAVATAHDKPAALNSTPLDVVLRNPDVLARLDPEKLHSLLDLQMRVRREEARDAFALAFAAAQSELSPVPRRGQNKSSGSKYLLLPDVHAELRPVLARHGLSQSVSAAERPREAGAPKDIRNHDAYMARFTLTIRHTGGHEEKHWLDAPVDNVGPAGKPNKTLLHGMRSSYSYCERTLIEKVWGIVAVDDDDDGQAAAVETIDAAQIANLKKLAGEVGADIDGFVRNWLQLDDIAQLPALRFGEAIAALHEAGRIRQKAKAQ